MTETMTKEPINILIVDDNVVNLKVVSGLLSGLGIKADTVESGQKCLQQIENKQYQMVLLDYLMPEMDGIETLHRIRTAGNKMLTVIALTAEEDSKVRSSLLQEGFDGLLEKPVLIESLKEVIDKFFPSVIQSTTGAGSSKINLLELDGPDICVQAGLEMFAGNEQQYIEILQVFLRDGKKKIELLPQYVEEDMISNFKTEVHALKSVAATIGAKKLSQIARRMEQASKNEELEFIKKNLKFLIKSYQSVLLVLEGFLKKWQNDELATGRNYEKLPEISEEDLEEKIRRLKNYIENFEQDAAIEAVDDILNYKLEDKAYKRFQNIKELLQEFDFQPAYELI